MPNKRIGDVDLAPGDGNVVSGDDILISRGGVDRRAHLAGKMLVPAFTANDAGKKFVVNSTGTALIAVADEKGADVSPTLGALTDGSTWAQKYSSILINYNNNYNSAGLWDSHVVTGVWLPVAPNLSAEVSARRNQNENFGSRGYARFTINSTMTEIAITYWLFSSSNITYYAFK